MLLSLFPLFFLTIVTGTVTAPATPKQAYYRDSSLPVLDRVAGLLKLMSQDEKLHQLLRGQGFDNATMPSTGMGMLEMGSIFANANSPSQAAANRNAVMRAFLSAGPGAKYNLPVSFRTLATHGGEAFGTIFPQGPGIGASFDVNLAQSIGTVMALENRALGIDLLTFVIHMVSDARFGRQEEGFSEDPMLTSAMAVASVEGGQGGFGIAPDDYIRFPYTPTLLKHLGAYGSPSGGLNGMRADVTEYTLRDSMMRPWRAAAAAGSRGVMPSHNSVLNCPAHANTHLLNDLLRTDCNQSLALILSDTGDVSALRQFRLCDSDASCAALALTAGVDIEQPPGQTYLALPQAIEAGLVTQAAVDAAVTRVLIHKFSSGIFDDPYVNETLADEVVNSAPHRTLARQAAEASIVLLKNENATLPLKIGSRLVVLGPLGGCGETSSSSSSRGRSNGNGATARQASLCEAQEAMLGNYAPNQPPLTGVPTLTDALSSLGFAASVEYHRGCNVEDRNTTLIPAAVTAASSSDVDAVIVVLGDSSKTCGESIDRDSLDLAGGQLELLAALQQAVIAKPLIIVLINGRTATFGSPSNALLYGVSALLVGWRPGQEGGAALNNVLFGAVNPSGKLPNSWVRAASHVGSTASPWLQEVANVGGSTGQSGAENRRYASYWVERDTPSPGGLAVPLFSFGSGLSYTTFALGNGSVVVQRDNSSFPLLSSFSLKNMGSLSGASSVLCFVQDPIGIGAGRIVRPWKRLIGFTKSTILLPGQLVQLELPIDARDLAFYNENFTLGLQPGNYTLSCGQSSTDDTSIVLHFTL